MGWFPFSSSYSSSKAVQCFYCSTHLNLLPPAPSTSRGKGKGRAVEGQEGPVAVGTRDGFWCSVCGQITRRDANGNILADDPAQFDASLNADSFEKRASTSTTHLPPSFPTPSTTPFCRQCLANQSLQLHLLASYPTTSSSSDLDSDSEGPSRNEEDEADAYPPLEEYRSSLDLRYPLVCPSCLPSIESTIRERDYRVKAQALGWRLRESESKRRREREEREEGRVRRRRVGRRRWVLEGVVWRVRGGLWALTGVGTVGWCCYALLRPSDPSSCLPTPLTSHTYSHLFLPLTLLSLFWSFWDPTWDRLRTERARGKVVNVHGKEVYVALQGVGYFLRVLTAVLLRFEVVSSASSVRYFASTLLVFSLLALLSPLSLPRLSHPPPILLAHSSTPTSSSSSPLSHSFPSSSTARAPGHAYPDPLEPLAHLSLSRKGSLLARGTGSSSPSQTPPGTPRGSGSGSRRKVSGSKTGAGGGSGLGGIRPRIPSFSLGSIPWGRDLAGVGVREGEGGHAMDLDPASAGEGDEAMQQDPSPTSLGAGGDADNSMDWTPLPPLSPPSHPSHTSAFASFPASTSNNHISFPRQRLIPPDLRKPTGLEGMFERVVGLREDEESRRDGHVGEAGKGKEGEGRRGWLSGLWRGA